MYWYLTRLMDACFVPRFMKTLQICPFSTGIWADTLGWTAGLSGVALVKKARHSAHITKQFVRCDATSDESRQTRKPIEGEEIVCC